MSLEYDNFGIHILYFISSTYMNGKAMKPAMQFFVPSDFNSITVCLFLSQ